VWCANVTPKPGSRATRLTRQHTVRSPAEYRRTRSPTKSSCPAPSPTSSAARASHSPIAAPMRSKVYPTHGISSPPKIPRWDPTRRAKSSANSSTKRRTERRARTTLAAENRRARPAHMCSWRSTPRNAGSALRLTASPRVVMCGSELARQARTGNMCAPRLGSPGPDCGARGAVACCLVVPRRRRSVVLFGSRRALLHFVCYGGRPARWSARADHSERTPRDRPPAPVDGRQHFADVGQAVIRRTDGEQYREVGPVVPHRAAASERGYSAPTGRRGGAVVERAIEPPGGEHGWEELLLSGIEAVAPGNGARAGDRVVGRDDLGAR
jgi:hypothetical protein